MGLQTFPQNDADVTFSDRVFHSGQQRPESSIADCKKTGASDKSICTGLCEIND